MAITTIEILVQGLGVCYVKNGLWKILLPYEKDMCHSSKYSILKDGGVWTDPVSLAKIGNHSLELTHFDSNGVAHSGTASGYSAGLIDLSSNYANSKPISLKAADKSDSVELKLNTGKVEVVGYYSGYTYALVQNMTGEKALVNRTFSVLPRALKFTVTLETGESFTIKSGTVLETIQANGNAVHKISIDNDCRDADAVNDFNVVADLVVDGKELDLQWIPKPVLDVYQTGTEYVKTDLIADQKKYFSHWWLYSKQTDSKGLRNPLIRNYPCFLVGASKVN